jgi:hypothetical protein
MEDNRLSMKAVPRGSGWVLLTPIYLDATNDPPATAGEY